MTANRPHSREGLAVLRAAGGAGCWSVDGFSGRPIGLSAVEVRARIGAGDRDMVLACLTGFEAGVLSGLAQSKEDET